MGRCGIRCFAIIATVLVSSIALVSLLPLLLLSRSNFPLLTGLGAGPAALTASGKTERMKKKTEAFVGWCGEWTPNGGLSDPEFDPITSEAIRFPDVPSCPLVFGVESIAAQVKVGRPYEPLPGMFYCDPPLRGGDRERSFHRDPAVLALDLRFCPPPEDSNTQEYKLRSDGTIQPEMSVVMPSHNSEEALQLSLPSLCRYMTGLWEIVVILDQCYDGTLARIRSILLDECIFSRSDEPSGLIRARVLSQPKSIFETSSDNLGFALAASNGGAVTSKKGREGPTHAYLEVQSDQVATKKGFNLDLLRPMLCYADIVAVSARCGHVLRGGGRLFGRCGTNIAKFDAKAYEAEQDTARVMQTVNRGPLLFRADALESLGFLDEVNFHQDNDDHDYNRRTFNRGWVVAYKYGAVYSPVDLSPKRVAAFHNKSPLEAKNQSHWYSVFRKEIQKEQWKSKKECDPGGLRWGQGWAVPFGKMKSPLSEKEPVGPQGEVRQLEPMMLQQAPSANNLSDHPLLLATFPPLPNLFNFSSPQ